MPNRTVAYTVAQNVVLEGRSWEPDDSKSARGIVLILHGMGDHIGRYDSFATFLATAGFLVHGYDQRGHGLTGERMKSRGHLGEDGFEHLVRDAYHVIQTLRRATPALPIILIGHSMGSFVAQSFLTQYGSSIDACVLCGSNGPEGSILHVVKWIARRISNMHGPTSTSALLTRLTFGAYNRAFRPNRTDFDWLSRDAHEIDLYLEDPHCGFSLTSSSMYDMFTTLQNMYRSNRLRQIPNNLPIFIIAGEKDPLSHFGRGIRRLAVLYQQQGLTNVTSRLYPGARHELFHEINRDEVHRDVLAWLGANVPRSV
ncbi:lysophospholipase [Alicyclobacillus fastidiosus]|uniref:Lysophospholipase n=1 Tax=Alicyclobacillus fastidiosus TaxID=392011 RepID=A0ABY6ZA43_9BACL|nr:alpha/beta hydrolase [Alicyclobacillus fastidiosus]WAH39699.1 lysophospholipase [Alicyclobacillus fastidiosus]GMA60915.1 alpha/beta hydrolase [Alicyclobacillus fastidiosus]